MMFEATEVVFDPGAYRAKLKAIEETERPNFDTGDPEPCRDWTFEILEEGYEGQTLKGRTSMSFGPRSKARAWVEGLMARRIETGEKLGLNDLLGKECDLSIVNNDTDRGTFANITSVNPVRKKSRKAEQAEANAISIARDGKASAPAKPDVPDPALEEDFDDIPF